jgi:hypothetical protein
MAVFFFYKFTVVETASILKVGQRTETNSGTIAHALIPTITDAYARVLIHTICLYMKRTLLLIELLIGTAALGCILLHTPMVRGIKKT